MFYLIKGKIVKVTQDVKVTQIRSPASVQRDVVPKKGTLQRYQLIF